jgi:CBS domain-containing protein
MRVEQLMTQPAITCRSSESLARAAQLMWENDCGSVPVVNEEGQLVGMITDRDICMAAYTQGSPLHGLQVASTMAKQVFSCRTSDTLADAEAYMQKGQVRRLPVVDSAGRPVGLLSLADLAREAKTPGSGKRNELSERELVGTMAIICEPRKQAIAIAHQGAA